MFSFLEIYGGAIPLTVVDVGAAPIKNEADPYAVLSNDPTVAVIGFEPNRMACDARNASAALNRRFFPYFVGDGTTRTFHECQNPLTSSLYHPNDELLSLFQRMMLPVVGSSEVATVRLDDLDELRSCDLLKLDVQGAELDVLRGAGRVLGEAVVVHTEVEFIPIYRNQSLFGDVDVELRKHGFWFHKFIQPFSRQFQPLVFNNNVFSPGSQLIYAEAAVYVRDFTRLHELGGEKLLIMARILHDVYESVDLVCVVLTAYDRKADEPLLPRYLEQLTKY